MIWQDALLMIGGFGFALALISTIKSKEKPHVKTSAITGSILITFLIAYSTLGLWLAFTATSFTCILWFILLVQGLKSGSRWN